MKLKEPNFEPHSISSNSFSTPVGSVLLKNPSLDSFTYTDSNFTTPSNITWNQGYFLISVTGFTSNTLVYLNDVELSANLNANGDIEVIDPTFSGGKLSIFNLPGYAYLEWPIISLQSNYSYIQGGLNTPSGNYSTVRRIDYSNDTANASIRNNLSYGLILMGTSSTKDYVWTTGGTTDAFKGSSSLSAIQRMVISQDTTSFTIRGQLNRNVYGHVQGGNENSCYVVGSWNWSNIQRMEYSSDTTSTTTSMNLVLKAGSIYYGYGDSATDYTNLYVMGGHRDGSTSEPLSYIQKLNFSNDTLTTGTSLTKTDNPAVTCNDNYAWLLGGAYPGPNASSRYYRYTYSNNTVTSVGAAPTEVYRFSAGGGFNYGYFVLTNSVITRLDYSNDTITSPIKSNDIFATSWHITSSALTS